MGNTNGEEWRWQRKAANSLLKKFEDEDKTIDLQDVLERFGFDNICKVAFSEDPNCLSEEAMTGDAESSKFMKAFDEAQKISIDRIRSPIKLEWKMKKLLNIGSEKHLRESVSIIHDYAMKIVRAKKKMNHDEHHDLLSSLASSREVSEEFTRDSITNLIFAGRDTVSSALTWFFWIISTRHAAITESMRLYPPASFISECCLKDDKLPDGTLVNKGWFMAYNSYAMGRMEGIWGKDCKEYKPERWLENGVFQPVSPFRYPIFNAGPRNCLGKEMAYIQMKLTIACVLENYDFIVVGKGTPEYLFSITIRMKGGRAQPFFWCAS